MIDIKKNKRQKIKSRVMNKVTSLKAPRQWDS